MFSPGHHEPVPLPQADVLAIFGFASAVTLLALWTCPQHQRSVRILTFLAQVSLAIYGFGSGAWPLGIVLLALAIGTLRKFPLVRAAGRNISWVVYPRYPHLEQTRAQRLFGTDDDDASTDTQTDPRGNRHPRRRRTDTDN
jgi:hypothetical protein